MNLMGPMLGHTGSALPESRFLLAEESFRLKELPGKVRCFNVALHRFVYMYGLCVSSCQRSSSHSVYIDVILWWPMVTCGLKCTCGFESIVSADGLPLCVMYSLVQWNWFSDVTDACNSGASSDHRGPISLHQAVHGIVQEDTCCQNIYCSCSVLGEEGGVCQLQVLCMQYVYVCFFLCVQFGIELKLDVSVHLLTDILLITVKKKSRFQLLKPVSYCRTLEMFNMHGLVVVEESEKKSQWWWDPKWGWFFVLKVFLLFPLLCCVCLVTALVHCCFPCQWRCFLFFFQPLLLNQIKVHFMPEQGEGYYSSCFYLLIAKWRFLPLRFRKSVLSCYNQARHRGGGSVKVVILVGSSNASPLM